MSYDIFAFDTDKAPDDDGELMSWYEKQAEWSEPHTYDDDAVTTPALRAFYREIKVVKLSGEFVWHSHADTDELFLVVKGELDIQMRDRTVTLGPGQLFVVPRGVEHCPIAHGEVHAVLIEPAGVVNTGDAGGPLTATYDDSLVT